MTRDTKNSASAIIIDLVVIHARDLLEKESRLALLHHMQILRQTTRRTLPSMRGFWLLLMVNTSQESALAQNLTPPLSTWCQGVRVVKESNCTQTARAALDFHFLHFPTVPLAKRATRICVLESSALMLRKEMFHSSLTG